MSIEVEAVCGVQVKVVEPAATFKAYAEDVRMLFARLLSVSAVKVFAGVLVMVMGSVTELWLLRQNTKTKSLATSVKALLVMEEQTEPHEVLATKAYATKVGVCRTAEAPGPGKGSVGPCKESTQDKNRQRRRIYLTTRQFKVTAPGVIDPVVLLQTLALKVSAVGYTKITSIPFVDGM